MNFSKYMLNNCKYVIKEDYSCILKNGVTLEVNKGLTIKRNNEHLFFNDKEVNVMYFKLLKKMNEDNVQIEFCPFDVFVISKTIVQDEDFEVYIPQKYTITKAVRSENSKNEIIVFINDEEMPLDNENVFADITDAKNKCHELNIPIFNNQIELGNEETKAA